jgi:hypothetical protein
MENRSGHMKWITTLIGILFFICGPFNSSAKDLDMGMESMVHSHKIYTAHDERISLDLPPVMKSHLLSNMRSHLEAVQSIIGLLSKESFDEASRIAHTKLGLTEEMNKMCNGFKNKNFGKLGLEFHKSGDDLGNVLQTKDLSKSLSALQKTMDYCVRCHKMFR